MHSCATALLENNSVLVAMLLGAGRDEGLSVVRLTVASEKWDISSDKVETPVNFGQDQDVFEIQVRADASHNA